MGKAVDHGRTRKRDAAEPGTLLRPHQGDARKMSAGDLREAVLARVDGIKGEVIEYVQGALKRNDDLAYKLKRFEEFRETIDKRLFDFGRRIAIIEKDMKSAIAAGILGQIKDSPVVQAVEPVPAPHPVPAEMPAFVKVRAPLPAWKKETKEAVSKLGSALPALASVAELAEYFGVSYNKIRNLILHGRLGITHQGRSWMIPRESVAEYLRVYGVPRPRRLFYGVSGVVESEK